jgi:hypothetical protein
MVDDIKDRTPAVSSAPGVSQVLTQRQKEQRLESAVHAHESAAGNVERRTQRRAPSVSSQTQTSPQASLRDADECPRYEHAITASWL